MTPAFSLIADRTDITAAITDRLLSLTLADRAGMKSDTLTLRLDDRFLLLQNRHTAHPVHNRDGQIELPRKGAELSVSLGYEQKPVKMGLYIVDELELSAPPATLTIRAKAANMRSSLKAHKTRAFNEMTLGKLVAVIAAEHGLEPRVGDALARIRLAHLDQTEESDLHLLTRLGKHYDALAKPAGGYLLFVPRGEAKSATGKTLPDISIDPRQLSDYRVTLADRDRYQAVVAKWHNTDTGEHLEVKVGAGQPSYTLRHTCPDAETAIAAAKAKLEALNRGQSSVRLTLTPGNPQMAAETKLTLSGFRDGINGEWVATEVDHQLSNSGYTTRVLAETPKR